MNIKTSKHLEEKIMRRIEDGYFILIADRIFLEEIRPEDAENVLKKGDLICWEGAEFYHSYDENWNMEEYSKLYRVPKQEPQVGEIIKLEDCKVGWKIKYTKESMEDFVFEVYIGQERTIERMDGSKVWFTNEYSCDGDTRVKLISKGEQGTILTNEMVAQAIRDQANKKSFNQQPLTTKDFQETMGKPRDEEIREAVCASGPRVDAQNFCLPNDFVNEMIQNITGLPNDAKHNCKAYITLYSLEFQEDRTYINIIRDGDGWKVEGT